MKRTLPLFLPLVALVLGGCNNSSNDESVVSQRYIHKYGYDVSKDEWESTDYPGQVLTTLRDGVTITATYEEGILHGPTTYTHPHSHTKECVEYYDRGQLVKKVNFSLRGIPASEELYLSDTHQKITKWFKSGTPQSIEEYVDGKLVSAEYTNSGNEILSRIEGGQGIRFIWDKHEKVKAKETYNDGEAILRETFFFSGNPKEIISLRHGKMHGEVKRFAETGEPLSIETYSDDAKHGLSTYFQNGTKYLELSYVHGMRDGAERHYVDGETLVEETFWEGNMKHGPSRVFYDGLAKTQWFYNNSKVSKVKFEDLSRREQEIAEMDERSRRR